MEPICETPEAGAEPRVVPATVAEAAEKQWCRIFRDAESAEEGAWARIAVAGGTPLREGDRVLAVWPPAGPRYVIGILEEASRPAPSAEVVASDGSTARHRFRDGEEVLELRDAGGRVLFEYRPDTGLATVHQPTGDLRLAAPGDIQLAAGRRLQVVGTEALDLRSAGRLCVESAAEEGAGRLTLHGSRAELCGEDLSLVGRRAALRAERVDATGESACARFERTSLVSRALEVTAERVLQRAKTVHQRVEDLLDVTVRRARHVVRETLRTRTGRFDLIARERVRIDGEKIHLG